MTLTSLAIAGLLAATQPDFSPGLFALASFGLIVAHAANNMMNDLFDTYAGLDRSDYPRALYAPHPVLSGLVTRKGLFRAALVANAIDAAVMVVLVVARGPVILAFALSGLAISYFYTAPPLRLKGRGVGEAAVAIVWGPLMVGGAYLAATGNLSPAVLWSSLPYALLVTTVLMGKHIDKAPWDRERGIKTLPVLMGDKTARRTTALLMAAFYASLIPLVLTRVLPPAVVVVAGALPALRGALRTYRRPKPDAPPKNYPLWPLWFASWAFVHARRAGALLVAGLLIDLIVARLV